ncbi:hypothetical protein HMI55_006826, partial [Coelomomyces lativittatus]
MGNEFFFSMYFLLFRYILNLEELNSILDSRKSFRDRVESNSSYTGGASTSSTATKKETISKAEWDAKLAAVQVSKT